MTVRGKRQGELELSFREGEFVWVDDGAGGRLLARIRSSHSLKLSHAQPVWLVSVRYPKGWGEAEHRAVKGIPTPAELARARAVDGQAATP